MNTMHANRVTRLLLAAFAASFFCGEAKATTVSLDFDAVTGATLAGTSSADQADSPIAIGSASLDLSGADGEFDAAAFAGFAIGPTDDRNLDFLFENTGGQSTITLNGVAASDIVSVTVYSTSFRDTNFTYDSTTTLVAASDSATIIDSQTGQSSYSFTFGAGTTDGEGNLAGVDISIVSPAPEPSTLVLALCGLAGLACNRRRRKS